MPSNNSGWKHDQHQQHHQHDHHIIADMASSFRELLIVVLTWILSFMHVYAKGVKTVRVVAHVLETSSGRVDVPQHHVDVPHQHVRHAHQCCGGWGLKALRLWRV